jgi:hypothetical protein
MSSATAPHSDIYNQLKDLIMGGFCYNPCMREYIQQQRTAYRKIEDLLENVQSEHISTNELDDLSEVYKFVIHDVHGYYPKDSPTLRLLLNTKLRILEYANENKKME